MKKTNLGIITAVAAVSLTVGVAASGVVEDITAQLRGDLKIIIDGKTQTFQDVNGQVVYPVMYNGTTYLPLRAIGGVMGKPVAWDGDTQTVTLGEKDALHSVIAISDKGDGAFGSKIIDTTQLTFPYGELKEDKTYQSAVRLEDVNSAEKEYTLKLDEAYAMMNVTLHNPQSSGAAVKMEVKDKKTDIVLLSKTLEPGQFIEATNVNLNSTDEICFCATGSIGSNDVAYFLDPQVK